jgi:hypothetical protein
LRVKPDVRFDRTQDSMQFFKTDRIAEKQPISSFDTSAPLVSTAAIGIVAFLYCVVLVSLLNLPAKTKDSALFAFATVVLPPLAVLVQRYIAKRTKSDKTKLCFETINIWIAASALFGLAFTAIYPWAGGSEAWTRAAGLIVLSIVAAHSITVAACALYPSIFGRLLRHLTGTAITLYVFIAAYWIATLLLFKVDPTQPWFSPFIRVFIYPPFDSWAKIGTAAGLALTIMCTVCVVYALETVLRPRHPKILRLVQIATLCIAIVSTFVVYFDFSLNLEPVHYLTIVGPALHVLHGGTLLVDVFSQYGPGPILIAIFALLVGPHALGTVQVAAQIFNLAFYAIWLICLFRMTRWKATASLLGFAAVAVLLAGWDYGNGNVNVAPSILGLRHLPTLCMVLAISCLQPPARLSVFTSLCTALSALWSFEALIGTLGLHLAFIAMTDVRARAYRDLVRNTVRAAFPALLSIFATFAVTLVSSGFAADYKMYLDFLEVYNPTSPFWSHAVDPQFLAWMTMLLSVFLVFGESWRGVFRPEEAERFLPPDALYYKFLPMAVMVVLTAAYYAFRSYDYTLLIALLPFLALAIPVILAVASHLVAAPVPTSLALAIPVFVGVSALTFGWLALARPDAPYSFLLQQCRDQGRCTVSALRDGLNNAARRRVLLETTGNFLSDRYNDEGKTRDLVSDAVKMIQREADAPRITVLLGGALGSELALMYTDKWQRWPISFAYTDVLVPALAERITAAPIALVAGELVIVRRDYDSLPTLEAGIFKRIHREYALCPIADQSPTVIGYRIATKGSRCRPD